MKHIIITSLLILSSLVVRADERLVLVQVEDQTHLYTLFDNQDLTIHYYSDAFIIASLAEGKTVVQSVVLDEKAFSDVDSYAIVYCYDNKKETYLQKIAGSSTVLYSGENFLIVKILSEGFMPAKNDGMIAVMNTKASLPRSTFVYPEITEPDANIQNLVSQVDTETVMGYIQTLENFTTRHCWHANHIAARDWIKGKYESMDLDVSLHTFNWNYYGSHTNHNVIAIQEGTDPVLKNEYIVLGGHYDSYTYESQNDAPGADDDASGSAGVMETARILSQYDFKRSIIYCAFSAEEYGLYGSAAYAQKCSNEGMNILGYFNLDMIGYLKSGNTLRFDLIYPNSALTLADYFVNICDVYFPTIPVSRYSSLPWGNSDHTSFNNKGYKGIWWFEDIDCDNPYIHHIAGGSGCGELSPCNGIVPCMGDVIGHGVNDPVQVTKFTQAMVASIATLAGLIYDPALPLANFEATTETTIVEGSTVQFTDLSTNDPTEWKWYFEGGTPDEFDGQNPPEILYETSGVYDVKLVVTNEFGSDELTRQKYITVTMTPPIANFEADVTEIEEGEYVTFTNLTIQNPQSFLWRFEGGTPLTSTNENPTIRYTKAGSYFVQLKATNTGGESTEIKENYITVTPKVAIAEQGVASVRVYPNPTDGELRIDCGRDAINRVSTITRIEVFDVFGRNVGVKFPSFGGVRGGNISHLPTGIYFLRIQTETDVITQKVVKM